MDNFDGIIEFVAVAESQGFSAAAKQMNCSTSHVSRQVSRLEARLGSALLARTTRSVSLTEAGQAYYRQCRDLVDGLQQANEQINAQQVQLNGTLRVSAAGPFAERYVVPALIEFAQQHPELTVDIDFNSHKINLIEDGIDFAIRYGKLEDSGLVARRLLPRPLMAVASPQYLQQHGTPTHPNQLKAHNCIVSNNNHWQFEHDGTALYVKVNGRWKSNNAHAVVNACEQHLGIAYMPKINFLQSISSGTLCPVLEPYWSQGAGSWIVYQNRRFLPMRARLAIDHLINYFRDWEE